MREAPPGFLWGTAICAHQSEGGNVNSDCWLLEHVSPSAFREPSGDACDSYHRYGEDLALAAELGFNTYRLGVEWARIEPECGAFSQAALDHYARVLEACRARGLAPMVTFSHFTTPRWFAARGGFEAADSADLFARFAERAARRLGPLMAYASTFNEANIARLIAAMPRSEKWLAKVAAMNAAAAKACGVEHFSSILFADFDRTEPAMLDAHAKATAAIKAECGVPVGATLAMQDIQSVDGADAGPAVAQLYGPWLDAAKANDFVGVQTYTRVRMGPEGRLPPPEGAEMTAANYEFYPEALGGTIRLAAREIGRPIIVTENGVATDNDERRIAFIDAALAEVRACLDRGVDVRGYIHWSLLDNFEWTQGYRQRFGLVDVDRATFERRPKPSARHLGGRARANQL